MGVTSFNGTNTATSLCTWKEPAGLTSDDADNIVNNLTLVEALLLTIIPSLATSLDSSYWNWLTSAISECVIDNTAAVWRTEVYEPFFKCVVAAFMTSICGIGLAMMYYILRPKGTKFVAWW